MGGTAWRELTDEQVQGTATVLADALFRVGELGVCLDELARLLGEAVVEALRRDLPLDLTRADPKDHG